MHKTTQSAKTIKPQTNIIPFPNRTKIVNQTITSTHLKRAIRQPPRPIKLFRQVINLLLLLPNLFIILLIYFP
ncbi:MAG: hypothetical protein FD167_3518 [bacterium]|nr:MAG: hypothetical protein FD167_3518 [bacterium]